MRSHSSKPGAVSRSEWTRVRPTPLERLSRYWQQEIVDAIQQESGDGYVQIVLEQQRAIELQQDETR